MFKIQPYKIDLIKKCHNDIIKILANLLLLVHRIMLKIFLYYGY